MSQFDTQWVAGVDDSVDEITIGDLLAWEPRLQILADGPGRTSARAVSWVVAARALPPALPKLRGGEIILLPQAMLREHGHTIRPLLEELGMQRIAAVVIDEAPLRDSMFSGVAPVPVLRLRGSVVNVELESELNRLLTETRGEIYRLGTELGRMLSSMTASGAGLRQVIEVTQDELGMSIVVTDRHGVVLAAAGDPAMGSGEYGEFAPDRNDPDLIEQPLRGGGRLWVGPVRPHRRALARAGADRLAGAVEAALSGANWFRSRGPDRGEALASFVLSAGSRETSEVRVQAVALGLDPSASFRIVLSASPEGLQGFHRAFAPYGTLHELAAIAGHAALLAELRSNRPGVNGAEPRGNWNALSPDANWSSSDWIAISGAADGLTGLGEAVRQASFAAGLLAAGLVRRSIVRYDRATELGGFRLLYELWGTPQLAAFADDILGDLVPQDRNGVLRQTLLHFLESGGSRVEAAERAAIHRNTLAYRLRRITELTRLDPGNPDDRLSLHLAVLAATLPAPG